MAYQLSYLPTTHPTFFHRHLIPPSHLAILMKNQAISEHALFHLTALVGEESDSHEGRLAARRRGRRSMKPGSSWAFQKALRDDVKKSKNFPANSRLDNFRKKIYDEDPRVMLPTLNIIQDAHG
jgi:hypothetical protein